MVRLTSLLRCILTADLYPGKQCRQISGSEPAIFMSVLDASHRYTRWNLIPSLHRQQQ